MAVETATVILAVLGIISILKYLIFKFISWKEEYFTLVLPVFNENEDIFQRIANIREFCEFCGIHKKCTIAIINYGASDVFIEKLKNEFGYSDIFSFVEVENIESELKEIMS
ncbi:MAG: hypothetical protein IKC01_04125 [Clostridia bacterium]|nr:hypothetical protein [Clostridia bacterium]